MAELSTKEKSWEDFINKSKSRLADILKRLNWTEEGLYKAAQKVQNPQQLTNEQKEKEEPLFPDSLPSNKSITLTEAELRELLNKPTAVVPQKFSDLQLNFTRAEKLQIYEYVAKSMPHNTEPTNSAELEQLSQIIVHQKREKKRRHKYRTMKQTYVEQVRSLIDMQMSAMQQYLKEKHKKDKRHKSSKKHKKDKRHKRHKNDKRREKSPVSKKRTKRSRQ